MGRGRDGKTRKNLDAGEMDAIRRLIELDAEGRLGGCDCPRCRARRAAMRMRVGGRDGGSDLRGGETGGKPDGKSGE